LHPERTRDCASQQTETSSVSSRGTYHDSQTTSFEQAAGESFRLQGVGQQRGQQDGPDKCVESVTPEWSAGLNSTLTQVGNMRSPGQQWRDVILHRNVMELSGSGDEGILIDAGPQMQVIPVSQMAILGF